MNVQGIGIDAIEIERFQNAVNKHGEPFLERIFTDKELKHAVGKNRKGYYMHMAGKFAAKEAVKKALPDGARIGLNWAEIEILNAEDGKPYAVLHGQAKELMNKYELSRVFVSISHTHELATSNAMVVKNGT
ncbi:MAG: holo-[acyl-carrier-protein] synthase [Candidatus Omnitrophica bacterium]|nr:holo-[acyl-carrier-protein] synthase [Candidatus Omnitrophota bacterium]